MIYARPGRRFLGFIVDYTVLALLLALFLPLFGVSVEQLGQSEAPSFDRALAAHDRGGLPDRLHCVARTNTGQNAPPHPSRR